MFPNFDGFLRFYEESAKMVKKMLLLVALIAVVLSVIGCQTAKGLKEDVTFIGDKTVEILEKE